MICINFDRSAGNAYWTNLRATGTDAWFDVIRQMTDAGIEDGPATIYDERGMACWTVMSIHKCAARYRPNDADKAARKAREQAAKEINLGLFGSM